MPLTAQKNARVLVRICRFEDEPLEGFGPPTYGLRNRRSYQLSYSGMQWIEKCCCILLCPPVYGTILVQKSKNAHNSASLYPIFRYAFIAGALSVLT